MPLLQSTADTMLWSGTINLDSNSISGFKYTLNSPDHVSDWAKREDLTGLPCGDPNSYYDRTFPTITSDTSILLCFGSCETDGSCTALPISQQSLSLNGIIDFTVPTGGSGGKLSICSQTRTFLI